MINCQTDKCYAKAKHQTIAYPLFVRQGLQNILPQTFRLAVIKFGNQPTIEFVTLSENNITEIPLQFGDEVDEVVFVVTGTTRYTRQRAPYRFELQPSN